MSEPHQFFEKLFKSIQFKIHQYPSEHFVDLNVFKKTMNPNQYLFLITQMEKYTSAVTSNTFINDLNQNIIDNLHQRKYAQVTYLSMIGQSVQTILANHQQLLCFDESNLNQDTSAWQLVVKPMTYYQFEQALSHTYVQFMKEVDTNA